MIYCHSDFDFIDFGASKGGSIEFARARLGGKGGIGIDLDFRKVEKMRTLGFSCIKGDITNIPVLSKSFRFVLISHCLEHLYSRLEVELAIREAKRIATDFIYIQGPFFDEDQWLRERGLQLFWSNWTGHTFHLTLAILQEIVYELGLGSNRNLWLG